MDDYFAAPPPGGAPAQQPSPAAPPPGPVPNKPAGSRNAGGLKMYTVVPQVHNSHFISIHSLKETSVAMIFELFAIYASIILGCIISTTCLILLDKNWGPLPHYYLQVIEWVQNFYGNVYPESDDDAPWPAIIQKGAKNSLIRTKASSSAEFSFLLSPRNHLEISVDAIHSGIEAIVQDNLSTAFYASPTYSETLLRSSPLPHWTKTQKAVFYFTLFFRFGFLFPTRLCLLLLSFVFFAGAAFVAVNKRLTDREKTWVGIVYCKLFCSAMGVVATYRNKRFRPRGAGVAISNHLSPNDVQLLFAGTPHGSSHGFVITGQKHTGIIGSLETLTEKVCPTFWVERKSADGRKQFLTEVIKKAKLGAPVLLFPEGYCSNSTQVLQFRKAVFEEGIKIYPIAIKQNSRFGDVFWYEDTFNVYLLRVMCSWATPITVTYLPPMTRRSKETNIEFAARAQTAISDVLGARAGEFGGLMWYSKTEQRRLLKLQQEVCAMALITHLHETAEKADSDEGYLSISSLNSSHCGSPIVQKCDEILSH
ncbi:PlsC domain-containing protein [Trichostrongylus colubriformis]|uniref:PlsC domain-containing protein n=1 Tax=Trichostrongylus colubriformis TaxID=6319 RepID=A0AAN8FVF7_TRICO